MLEYIVFPFKFVYLCLYLFLYQIVDSYTVALLLLSPVTVVIISVCQKFTRKIETKELKIQGILKEQIKEISQRYKGKEKNDAIDRLYKRYSYSPVYSVRSAANVFIQLPFLLGAYYMLSDYEQLKYVSFGIISNLYRPDGLINGINLLPFVMFAVGTINVFLNKNSERSERKKGIFINLFFLIVLYPAPSALLIYWTTNNILFLVRSVLNQSCKSVSIINNDLLLNLIKHKLTEYEKYLFLVLLWPFVHLCCNNIGHYPVASVVFSGLIYIPFIYLFSRLFCFAVFKFIPEKDQFILFVFSSFIFLVFLTDTVIKYFFFYGIISFIILLLASILLKYRGQFHRIVSLLVILNVCEILMGGYSFAKNVYSDNQMVLKDRKLDSEEFIDLSEIRFDVKPSFYYIHMESLNSPRILRDVYKVDEPEFYDFLRNNGFAVSDSVYSNGRFTQLVLKMMFTMRLWKENDPSGILTTPKQQGILSGNRENILFRIFKNNGYSTAMYFLGQTYFFSKNGTFLDYSDIESFCQSNVFQPIFDLKKSFFYFFYDKFCFGQQVEKDPLKILENHFLLLDKLSDKRPQLVFIDNLITHHSPVDGTYSYKQKAEWAGNGRFEPYEHPNFNFREAVHISLMQTKKMIELILSRDPGAVVILQGDHGAHRLLGYPWDLDYRNFVEFAKKDGESYQTVVDDMFSVFSAIRIPEGKKINGVYSNATIFPKILTLLNEKLKDKFESLSPMNCSLAPGDKVVVKDGKLIEFSDVSLCNLKE